MRKLLAAIMTGGLVATLGATGSPAYSAPMDGWELNYEAGFVDVYTKMHGELAGHEGNWHTAYLNFEGDDDWVTGAIVDWTCADGVEPNGYGFSDPETCERGDTWGFEEHGGPGPYAKAWWSPKLRYMTVRGPVDVLHYGTGVESRGSINVRVRAYGAYTETVWDQTDDYLYMSRSRTGTVARGRILFTALNGPGYQSGASDILVDDLYTRVP